MYDECSIPADNPNLRTSNCPYNGTAKPLENITARMVLEEMCPHMMVPDSKQLLTCCSPSQVFTFKKNIAQAEGILGRCPNCMTNFKRHICELTCSTRQSNFMKLIKESINDKSK